jgi:hypothetical protein
MKLAITIAQFDGFKYVTLDAEQITFQHSEKVSWIRLWSGDVVTAVHTYSGVVSMVLDTEGAGER